MTLRTIASGYTRSPEKYRSFSYSILYYHYIFVIVVLIQEHERTKVAEIELIAKGKIREIDYFK